MASRNLFKAGAGAAAKAGGAASDPPKGTTWAVRDAKVAASMRDAIAASARIKVDVTQFEAARAVIEEYAGKELVKEWAARAALPDQPIKLTTDGGLCLLFVVQDRSKSCELTDAAINALAAELGATQAAECVTEVTTHTFSAKVLALTAKDPLTSRKSTIAAMLNRRIQPLLDELVESDQITRVEADSLLSTKSARVLSPGFIGALPGLCEHDPLRLGRAILALGAALVRYIKPG